MNAPVSQAPIPSDFAAAARAIADKINGAEFQHGDPGHPQKLNVTANLSITLPKREDMAYYDPEKLRERELLKITLDDSHLPTIPASVRDQALKSLMEIAPLAEQVQFETATQAVASTKTKLEEFISKGAKIDPRIFTEWKGFEPERKGEIEEHALQNLSRSYPGATFMISTHKSLEDKKSSTSESARLTDSIAKDEAKIKAVLAYQLKKYVKDKTPEEIDTQVQAMVIKTSAWNNDSHEGIQVRVLSPEQAKVADKEINALEALSDEEKTTLRESNLLTRQNAAEHNLSDIKFGKTLGRAFLYEMEEHEGKQRPTKPREDFFKLAGSKDVQNELAKSLKRYVAEHPCCEAEVKNFLDSDLFKKHDRWDLAVGEKPEEGKSKARIYSDDNGKLVISADLPNGKALGIVKAIAAQYKPAPATDAPQVAAGECPPEDSPSRVEITERLDVIGQNLAQTLSFAQEAAGAIAQGKSWTKAEENRPAAATGIPQRQ